MAKALRQGVDLDRVKLSDLARAGFELGLARLRLSPDRALSLIGAAQPNPEPLDREQTAVVDRVAFVIPRVAVRLPWRADCLVQAIAARSWLSRQGIATTLTLGVPRDKPANFEAHAWLTAGDVVVTGGNQTDYQTFSKR